MNDGKQTSIPFTMMDYGAIAILRIAAIENHGRVTYGPDNWKKIMKSDNLDHALQHLILAINEMKGIEIPECEQGEDHLAHAAARIMMAMGMEVVNANKKGKKKHGNNTSATKD